MTQWERSVPVYGVPVLNRGFWGLLIVVVIGLILSAVREVLGLGGSISGMSDPYAWGLWKTFNVMVLTGIGSGGFAVGIAAWVFNRTKLHQVMRVALLTSFLAYSTGLVMLGIDVGRPWNFYWVMLPMALEPEVSVAGSRGLHYVLCKCAAASGESAAAV